MKIKQYYKTLLTLLFVGVLTNTYAQIPVEWKNLVGCTTKNSDITKNINGGSYNAGANSANVLASGQNGWASFIITQLGQKVAFGFSQVDNGTDLASIEFAFETNNNNKLKIYNNGTLLGTYGNVQIGDILKIERDGLKLNFYRNNIALKNIQLLYTTNTFFIDASIATQGASILNAVCSFKKPLTVNATVYDVVYLADTLGSVYQSITGGTPPYTTTWRALSTDYTIVSNINSQNLKNADVGQYESTVEDLTHTIVKTIYTILNKIDWRDSLNIITTDSSIIKSNNTNSWTNSGAYSLQEITRTENGVIAHRITSLNAKYAIGVSRVKTNYNYTSMEYCFMVSNNKLAIYKKGALKIRFNTNLTIGDDIYMQRQKDTILFYHNNLVFFKEKMDSLTPLRIQTSLFKGSMELRQTRTSFRRPLLVTSTQIDVNCILNSNGRITLTPNGGSYPYLYTLTGRASTNQNTIDNLSAGTYTVNIKDKVNRSINYVFTIYNCPIWVATPNVITNQNGNLVKTAEDSWTNTILNTNEAFEFAQTPSWIRFAIPDTLSEFLIGFRSIEFDSTAQVTNYKLYVKNSLVTIIETDNDGFYNKREIKRITTKTEFLIQLTTNGIEYYSRTDLTAQPTLEYTSKLFSNAKLIIETNLYKNGSKINGIRVSDYGNTSFPVENQN